MAKISTDGSTKKRVLIAVYVLVVVGLAVFGGWNFNKSRDLQDHNNQLTTQLETTTRELQTYKTDPTQANKAEVARIVAEVGELYALPKDEEPSVATVKDKEKLKDQPFFAKAENADITLIYSNAKLAILYRPSSKQIINVSSVTIQDQTQPAPTTP